VTTIEDFLRSAGAYDSNGQIRVERVQGSTGQWFLAAVDADGEPVMFWGPPDARFVDDKAFRDEAGNVLMSIVVLYNGGTFVTSVDASLRPTISIASLIGPDGSATSANPGGWPLTPEELDRIDRGEPPETPREVSDWERRLLAGVARDELGRPLTTRVKAADGQWADVLMMESGASQRLEIDFGMLTSGTPDGRLRAATTVRAGKRLIVAELDQDGHPVIRPANP
jgi:hypothetical protein